MNGTTISYWLYLLPFFLIEGAHCFCLPPPAVTDGTPVVETAKTTYEAGDMVLFECSVGNGHVSQFCQKDDSWGNPSRSCSDSIVWEVGGMSGVVVAGVNYVIAIFAVVYSKIKYPDLEEKEDKEDDKDDKDKANDKKKNTSKEPVNTVVVLDDQHTSRDIKLEETDSREFSRDPQLTQANHSSSPVDV